MSDLTSAQETFTQQMPRLKQSARFHFKMLPPDAQEEAIQNSITLAWKYYSALSRKGRSEEAGILNSCLRFSVKQTREGRMLGKHCHTDVLDLRQNGKVRFQESNLNDFIGKGTPIPDAVSFRQDVPQFLNTLTTRQQSMALDLANGESTGIVAEKYGLTAGAVSQFRTRFKSLFEQFFGE